MPSTSFNRRVMGLNPLNKALNPKAVRHYENKGIIPKSDLNSTFNNGPSTCHTSIEQSIFSRPNSVVISNKNTDTLKTSQDVHKMYEDTKPLQKDSIK